MQDTKLTRTAAAGILVCSLVTLSAATRDYFVALLIGTLLGWVPYLATAFSPALFKLPPKYERALPGGLILYLILDTMARYKALHNPSSSTDAVAIVIVLLSSVLIIPAGAFITYLLLPKMRAGM